MNEEQKYELLNQYIDALHAEQSTADLETNDEEEATLRMVARLLKAAVHPEAAKPSTTFASALEKHLIRQHQIYYSCRETRPWWARILANPVTLRRVAMLAALATVLAFSLLVAPWARKPPGIPSSPHFSLVAVAEAATSLEEWPPLPGVLGNIEFKLETPLPASSPREVMIYRQVADPISMQEAEELAQRFGIQGSVQQVGASWVAENEHSRLEVSSAQKGYYYYRNFKMPLAHNVSVDATEAIRLAQRYLEQRGLLDFDHGSPLLLAQSEGGAASPYRILFPQIVDGLTIENAGVTVILTKDGEVAEIRGRVLRLESVGQQPILPVEAAYQALQDPGTRQTIWVEVNDGGIGVVTQVKKIQQLEPSISPSPYRPGDYVEIEGVINATVFQDASGVISYTQAFLTPATCAPSLRLTGVKVDELTPLDGYRVKMSGLIVGDPTRPALIVETYHRTHPQEQAVVLLGSLEVGKEQDVLLLHSPENTTYALVLWCQNMPSLLIEYSNRGWSGAKVLVRGILTGEQAAGKYPIVRVDQIHTGPEIEALESLSPDVISRLAPRPSVAPAAIPVLSGEGQIEEVDLILFAFPLPFDFQNGITEPYRYLIPAYRFAGRTADGVAFTIYVQAIPTGGQ